MKQSHSIEKDLDAYRLHSSICAGHTDDVMAVVAPDICFEEPLPGKSRGKKIGRATEVWRSLLDHEEIDVLRSNCWRPLFSISTDRNVRMWKVFLGEIPKDDPKAVAAPVVKAGPIMLGHKEHGLSLAFDPGNEVVYSGSRDNTILSWDLASGKCLSPPWTGHTDKVTALAYVTGDSPSLVSGSLDKSLRLWSVDIQDKSRGTLAAKLQLQGEVRCVTNGDDAKSGTPRVWAGLDNGSVVEVLVSADHLKTGHIFRCGDSAITSLALDSGTDVLFAGSESGHIYRLEVERGPSGAAEMLSETFLHSGGCEGLAIGNVESADGEPSPMLYSTGGDGAMAWQISSLGARCIQRLKKHSGAVHGVCPVQVASRNKGNPDVDLYLATAGQDRSVRLWEDLLRGSNQEAIGITKMRGHATWVWSICHDNAGRLFSASHDHTLKVWDLNSHEEKATITDHSAAVRFVAYSDNRIFTASADRTIKIFDATTYKCVRTLRGHTNWVNALAVDKERGLLYSVSGDAMIKQWDIESGDLIRTFEGHESCINTINVMYDLLVSGDNSNVIRVWHTKTGLCVAVLSGHKRRIRYVLPDLETGTLYSASEDGDIKIWTRADNFQGVLKKALVQAELAASGKMAALGKSQTEDGNGSNDLYTCTETLSGHTDLVRYVLKHGNILYSSSNDQTIRCWNLQTGKCIKVLSGGHIDLINSLVLIDGTRLLSCSHDSMIVQWDVGMLDAPLVHLQSRYGILDRGAAKKLSGVKDDNGTTSLMTAAAGGSLVNAKIILESQKNFKLTDKNDLGHSALLLALRGRRFDFLKYFADLGSGPSDSDEGAGGGVLHIPFDDRSVRELIVRRAARGDSDFFIKLRENHVELGKKMEDLVIMSALAGGHHELVMNVWGATRGSLLEKLPLHKACFLGEVRAATLLARNPKVDVNSIDSRGATPLHHCFLPDKKDVTKEIKKLGKNGVASEEYVSDSIIRLWMARIECARSLLAPSERSNKPLVLQLDDDHFRAYDRALQMHERARQEMRKPLNEARDQARIDLNRRLFLSTVDTLDMLHDEKSYPEVVAKRHRFARQYFYANAIPYAVFLILLALSAFFLMVPRDRAFMSSNVIESQVVVRAFEEGAAMPQVDGRKWFWDWMEVVAVPALYPDDIGDPPGRMATNQQFVGPIQIRQIRMKPEKFARPIVEEFEERDDFTLGSNWTGDTEWYEKSPALGLSLFSRSETVFPASGFVHNFGPKWNQSRALAELGSLKDFSGVSWIDNQTRFVSISVNTINENWGYLMSAVFSLEFDPAGGAWPDYRIYVIDPETPYQWYVILLLIVLTVWVCYEFLYLELADIYKSITRSNSVLEGLRLYFSSLWNYLELSLFAMFIAVVILQAQIVGSDLRDVDADEVDPVDLFSSSETLRWRDNVLVIFTLLCYLRMIKYLAIPRFTGPTTQAIIDTLTGTSVLIFISIIIYVILCFALVYHLAFASDLPDYFLATTSFMTLFRMVFGDFDYQGLNAAAIFMGPVLFITFMILVPLLLLNLLIAVLTEAYTTVFERNTQMWERSITDLMIENLQRNSGIRYTIKQWRIGLQRRGGEDDIEMQGLGSSKESASSGDNPGYSQTISFDDEELGELIDSSSLNRTLTLRDVVTLAQEQGAALEGLEDRTARIESMIQELILKS